MKIHSLVRLASAGGKAERLPEEESAELRALKPCQVRALLHVWRRSRALHGEAYASLQARAEGLGFSALDLRQTLAYIREDAPIIIHVDLARHGAQLARDTHYRNLFETQRGDGGVHAQSREDWEEQLFRRAYCGAAPFDRCKYGVLNVTNDPQGVRCCAPVYGSSYLLLRGVRLRTTFAAEDSAGLEASELATVRHYAHVLERYTDAELQAALEVGTQRRPGVDSTAIMVYKEAQIHGEVRLTDHVALVMAHPSTRESDRGILERLARRCNAPLVWMEDSERVHEVAADDDLQRGLSMSLEDEELRLALEISQAECHGPPQPRCLDDEGVESPHSPEHPRWPAEGAERRRRTPPAADDPGSLEEARARRSSAVRFPCQGGQVTRL